MAAIATRRERVILELEDNFTTKMAKAAVAAAALDKSLSGLSGSAVRSRGIDSVAQDIDKVSTSSRRAGADIDRFSGRLGLLRDVALTIGPAFVPIGAIAIPALTGLAAQAGAVALAGGTMIAAFQGMGEALEAANEAALEPTADNLEAARIAMERLSPQAQEFAQQIQSLRPALLELRDAAGEGLFPGLGAALDDMTRVLPNLEQLLSSVGTAAGDVAAEFGAGLSGPRGEEFLRFLSAEVPAAVRELGSTVGNLAAGMAELWMAFTPVNRDFSGWLLDASASFDRFASGLSQTEGFREFVAYLRENGPRVADAMGAIGNAVLQVVQAMAPLGGPALAGLEAVADLIAAIADSPAGPALFGLAAGLALVSRAVQTIAAIRASSLFIGLTAGADGAAKKLTGMQRAAIGAAAALGGLLVIDSLQGGLEDYSIGIESMTKSLLDLQAGTTELPKNLEGLANSIDRLANPGRAEALQDSISNALGGIGNEEEYDKAVAQIEALDAALSGLVAQGRSDVASGFLEGLNLSESQMRDLMGLLPQYRDALAGAENQSRLTGEASARAGREAAGGFREATGAAQRFRTALAAVNRILEGRSSARDYQQALDDMTRSIRQNGRTLDTNTQKGRENEMALDAIAASAIAVAENMRGTNRTAFLQQARRDIVDASSKLKGGEQNVRQLLAALREADNAQAKPSITADVSDAMRAIGQVQYELQQLDGRVATTRVQTIYTSSGRRFKDGPGFATGGYTGDGPWDEPRGFVHAGEVVIPKNLVMRDWHLLKARYGHLPGFSSGGLVGAQRPVNVSTSVAAPNVNVGSPSVGVFIDGQQFRGMIRAEIKAHATYLERQADRD